MDEACCMCKGEEKWEKPEIMRPLVRLRHRWENITMHHREM